MSKDLEDRGHPQNGDLIENDEDRCKNKKRKRGEHDSLESSIARKKHRSKKISPPLKNQVATLELPEPLNQDSIAHSPFNLQTASLYLSLPPIAQHYPLQGLCTEHLSPLILTYCSPLGGFVLSYQNVRLSTRPPGASDPKEEVASAQSIDEYAAPHVWVTADFLLFRPRKRNRIEGRVNLQNEGNIGLVCWNFFSASIEKKRLPQSWKWRSRYSGRKISKQKLKDSGRNDSLPLTQVQSGLDTNEVDDVQGYFEDQDTGRVQGLITFWVKDVDTSRSSGGDNGFISIEGTLLQGTEEQELCQSEFREAGLRGQRKKRHKVPLMSGALDREL
ncbi:MAG: hypothetical protein Q9183_001515 [Haloplaca sp. 2 TL-2023]